MRDVRQEFVYYQPKWKGRRKVKSFAAALVIGSAAISLHYVYNKVDAPGTKGWTREAVLHSRDFDHRPPEVLSVTVFLLNGTTTWAVPSNFGTLTSVECLGAGSSGNAPGTSNQRGGGAGGAYAKITSTSTVLTPGVTSVNVGVGLGGASVANNVTTGTAGGDTWWNATSRLTAVSNGSGMSCAAQGGQGATAGAGGLGGTAANSVGTTTFSGGNGGTGTAGGEAGGGAAGPAGAGGIGGATAGGSANNATTAGPTIQSNGLSGTEFDGTHGCGTGAFSTGGAGETGGLYGGGGTCGNAAVSGPGANGLLVIIHTLAKSSGFFSKPIRFSTRRF